MPHSDRWPTFPKISGTLTTDTAACRELGANFGRHVVDPPGAVIRPATPEDVIRVVRWAREHAMPIAVRGEAHSTFRQTLAGGGGLLIDMRGLASTLEFGPDSVLVQAGALWSQVLETTLERGMRPPTLTDYLGLSVGGTLSVGGIGGETYRHGAQVEMVTELEVVTGGGQLVRCSASDDPELFDACRGGLGQFGIIISARLKLVPVVEFVQTANARFSSLDKLLSAMTRLTGECALDHIYSNIALEHGKGWQFELVASRYGAPVEADWASLEPTRVSILSRTPKDFAFRVNAYVDAMQSRGTWQMAHPWLDLLVPMPFASEFISRQVEEATLDADILIYPLRREACRAPTFRVPDDDQCVLFDVLRNVQLEGPALAESLARNRRAYEDCAAHGGKLYPIGSTPMSREDWACHFGQGLPKLQSAKRTFDPDGLLGRGMEIF